MPLTSTCPTLLALLALACPHALAAPAGTPALPEHDLRAARELERQVLREARASPEWALARALRRMRASAGATAFENVPGGDAEDDTLRFPALRPRGAGKGEWRALRRFNAGGGGAGGERGSAHYTLLDLDGDGLRDLVVRTYNGGTSLVWETTVLRNAGGHFVAAGGQGEGFFESGRGGNEGVDWVRLDGRIYLAYRVGRHGEDKVTLYRPFLPSAPRAWLSVRYRYAMGDPVVDVPDAAAAPEPVAPGLRAALKEAVARAGSGAPADRPVCPPPEGVDPDDAAYAGSPLPYYVEHIGDAAVWVGGRCLVGQLSGGFGAYTKDGGLGVRFCLRAPEDGEGEERCYAMDGRRKVSGTEVGVDERSGGQNAGRITPRAGGSDP